jgi:DNA-binding XRE family transcriptional regulator
MQENFDTISFESGADCMDEQELQLQYTKIIEILKNRRKELKYTQEEIGAKVGCGRPHIVRYETGVVTPKLDTLIKWANALGLKIEFTIK